MGHSMFGEETVRSGPYLDMLQHFFIPQLQQDNSMDIVFRQDVAPPHWATVVRDYLDDTFDGNWCGRSGPIMLPPNSPDHTPPDFFLWGFVKNDVYSQRPTDIAISKKRFAQLFKKLHLKCYITHGMQYLHDMNCVVYTVVVMLWSNLIWTKLPCCSRMHIHHIE